MPTPLEFGWYLPTHGDTTAFGDPASEVPPSPALLERIVAAAENAGFEYLLIPVGTTCWEAWTAGTFLAGRSRFIKPLVAARPGYINPVLFAKMITTLDQLSGGRVAVNLIAGQNEADVVAEGVTYGKEDRYDLMDEEVSILKALWTSDDPLQFDGRFHKLKGAIVRPVVFQKPYPRFYLGGGSEQAWEISAKHADVHLFWGDTPQRVAEVMTEIRQRAARHGRADAIGFGMRLQIICRESADDAWAFARGLIARGTDADRARVKDRTATSVANQRVQQLAAEHGEMIGPNLWTGLTKVRQGAGIAVVGDPEQCAAQLQEFIDVGCRSFCLSGYLHDEEAERFGRLVRPLLEARNPGRMKKVA